MPNKDPLWRDNNYQSNSKVIMWLKGNAKVEETLVLTLINPILTSHLTVIVLAPVRVDGRDQSISAQ
ncbi:hypothetical protein BDV34DRAFT_194430 [Aspergillus parasiticus]|uniref:Uncharacterized protein n=1 Tax=Aspergillus parasiticus TaxID=5067 RepID=A0A5N6DMC7_ASPPA|nr:hypothetical protein BDV34DRAFT_194430 [Aspergillus parasiticus]